MRIFIRLYYKAQSYSSERWTGKTGVFKQYEKPAENSCSAKQIYFAVVMGSENSENPKLQQNKTHKKDRKGD